MPFDVVSNNEVSVRYVEETTLGVTPVNPAMRELEKVAFDLGFRRNTVKSNRIKSNRRPGRNIGTSERAEGSLSDELSIGDHDPLLAALACGTWVPGVSVAGSFAVAGGKLVRSTGSWVADGIRAGDVVDVEGAAEGRFRVVSVTATELELDEDLDAAAATESGVAVVGYKLTDGKKVRSFTFERATSTEWAEAGYEVSRGVRVNTAAINLTADGIATINYGLIGLNADLTDAPLDAAVDASQGGSLLCGANAEVYVDGESIGTVVSMDLSVSNGIQATGTVGSREARALTNGGFDVTGNATLLLDSPRWLKRIREGARISLGIRMDAEDGSHFLALTIPQVFVDAPPASVSGEGVATIQATLSAEDHPDGVLVFQRSNA